LILFNINSSSSLLLFASKFSILLSIFSNLLKLVKISLLFFSRSTFACFNSSEYLETVFNFSFNFFFYFFLKIFQRYFRIIKNIFNFFFITFIFNNFFFYFIAIILTCFEFINNIIIFRIF